MNKTYILEILQKAGWAALYGALAEIIATQNLNKSTIFIALLSAGIRGFIVFATTISDSLNKKTDKSYGFNRKNWKNYL